MEEDLSRPLGSILLGTELLARNHPDLASHSVVERIGRSATRMAALVDDVLDFTRGRMGSGIPMRLRAIEARIAPNLRLRCDPERIAQLLSNLLKNVLVHGSAQVSGSACTSSTRSRARITGRSKSARKAARRCSCSGCCPPRWQTDFPYAGHAATGGCRPTMLGSWHLSTGVCQRGISGCITRRRSPIPSRPASGSP